MFDDLDTFFSDFAVSATWNGQTGPVIMNSPDNLIEGFVNSTRYEIVYKTAQFVGMKTGDSITVGGTDYKVSSCQKIEDGKLTTAILHEV